MCLAIMDAVSPPFPVNDVIDLGKVTSRVPPCLKLSFGFLEDHISSKNSPFL